MAKGTLTVLADSQDNKILLDKGTLTVLDNQIVQTSGTMRVKANFPNPAARLWPGELINIRVLIETRANTLTVPAPAVQQGPKGAYVYVIGAREFLSPRARHRYSGSSRAKDFCGDSIVGCANRRSGGRERRS
jgi:multidrug efflux pump subunit AcrA (membrane-fusion protein)